MSDSKLAFVQIPATVREQLVAGEIVDGTLRPKRRGDGPAHSPVDWVFEPAAEPSTGSGER